MRWTIQRAVDVGFSVLAVAAVGIFASYSTSCMGGWDEPCGDSYCLKGYRCDHARGECVPPDIPIGTCGNGIVEDNIGEVCDDGNELDGDGCSANCMRNEVCGDGIVDTAAGEICDDGNEEDGDGCSRDCMSDETCSNGITDTAMGEVCDDGNLKDGDGCSRDCMSTEKCGNGIIDDVNNEICDDGNREDGDGCSGNCMSDETCGNGIIDEEVGEVCDDGNNDPMDSCSTNCKSSVQCLAEEVTDDGGTYILCMEFHTWQEAVDDCDARGMHLVTIGDLAENQLVFNLMEELTDCSEVWLGASDREEEGIWSWVDGTEGFDCTEAADLGCTGGFSQWNDDEPNNSDRGTPEHCAVMRSSCCANGNWDDVVCENRMQFYVCEG